MSNIIRMQTKAMQQPKTEARRFLRIILTLCTIATILFIVSLSVGSSFIHPVQVIKELIGFKSGEYDFILHTLR